MGDTAILMAIHMDILMDTPLHMAMVMAMDCMGIMDTMAREKLNQLLRPMLKLLLTLTPMLMLTMVITATPPTHTPTTLIPTFTPVTMATRHMVMDMDLGTIIHMFTHILMCITTTTTMMTMMMIT